MNKHCYRVIFNKTRQMLMVVSDLARSHTPGQVRRGMHSCSSQTANVSLIPLVWGISLALGLVSQTAQAGIVADNNAPGTQQPTVISAANGVPQVNIQTPNSDGVSRNQYSQFDVEQRGAILNNSGVNTQTDLGGLITANPWLAQGEANIILNEVNSRDPSQLNGFIEVAGKRADVIIANPAGITCNGCGFINASQTTLAVGQTILENGRLKGFEVGNGILTVDGKGLNDTTSDYTRLIARAVNINAKLHAQDLTVTTGRNRVDVQGNVEKVHVKDTEERVFNLDVAAVGGMYANKIKLVGTEQGVGVRNAGQLGAQAGNLTLDTQGNLTNSGMMTASAEVAIQNQGTLTHQGDIKAGQSIKIQTRDALENQGRMLAGRNLDIQSAALKSEEKGVLAAGVDKDGHLTQPGNVVLRSDGHFINRGVITATGNITLPTHGNSVQGNLVNQGKMTAGQDISIENRNHLDNQGRMLAGRHLDIQSASLENKEKGVLAAGIDKDGKLTQQGNLTIHSRGALANQGMMAASDNMIIQNKSGLANQGQILAGSNKHGNLTLHSEGKLDNSGTINASVDVFLQNQGGLDNVGEITSGRDVTIKARDHLANQGKMSAGRNLDITSASLNNQKNGVLAAGIGRNDKLTQPGNVVLRSDGHLINRGVITATGNITLPTHDNLVQGNLVNQGDITAGQDISIENRNHLDNQGQMLAGRHLDIHSASLENQQKGILAAGVDSQGKLIQSGSLAIRSNGKLTNRGVITASDDVILQNQGDLTNQGDITVGQDVTIKTRDHFDNQGRILAGRHLDSQSASLHSGTGSVLSAGVDKYGKLTQNGNLTLKAREAAQLYGQNLAHDNLSVDAKNIALQGSQTAAGNLQLTSGTQLNLQDAKVRARQNLTLSAPELIDNQRGELEAETLSLTSRKLKNNQGKITQTGQLSLVLDHHAGIDNTEGVIASSGQDLMLRASTLTSEKGVLTHAGTGVMSIDTQQFQGKKSRLISDGELKLTGGNYHWVKSRTSAQQITAHIQSLDHRLGDMTQHGKRSLTLDVQQELDNGSGTIAANGTVEITADRLNNNTLTENQLNNDKDQQNKGVLDKAELNNQPGKIIAAEDGHLQVTVKNPLNNQAGQLLASKSLVVSASAIDNRQGQITSSGGDITLTTGQLDNLSGKIAGQHHLQLNTQSTNNEKGHMSADTVDINTHQQGLNNTAGLIVAERNMILRTGELLNRQGSIHSGQDLTLNTHGNPLDNRDSGQQGGLFSQGAMHLNTGYLNNQSGHIESRESLSVTGKNVANQQGQILGGKGTRLTVADLNNDQGLLQSGGKLTLKTTALSNRQNRDKQGITSKQALELETDTLNNENGVIISADSLHIQVNAAGVNNHQGLLAAHTMLTLVGLGLSNQSGRIQSHQALWVDTQGQTLNNTGGVIDSQDALDVRSGDLLNQNGTLHGKSAVTLTAKHLDNRHQGKILSENGLVIEADDLSNEQGRMLALGDFQAKVKNHIDNKAGLIRSGGDLRLNAQHLSNQATRQQDKGIDGRNIVVTAETLHNRQGQLTATENADLTLSSRLDNTQGLLQSNQKLTAQGQTLAVTNTGGDIKTGQALGMEADSLTGDGKLRSLGDMTLTLLKDFTHTGETIANGRLVLDSRGDIINNSLISAGTLEGRAANLTNEVTGKILANHHQWTIKDNLNNTGLLDGAQTYLKAAHLTNQGTGHIYGDHIAIEAGRLDNLAENNKSAVIAARNRLDIGTDELNNKTHSLIYSDGDLSIGGQLDSQQHASGKGKTLNNHSASIEATGDMRLAMANINNLNDHFETELRPISQESIEEYQVWGQRYNVKNHKITIDNDEVDHACIDNRGCEDEFQIYKYTRTTEESRVKTTDPAKILAGKNLTVDTTVLTNDKSQVVAGGLLTVTGGQINNTDVQGERQTTDKGRIEYFWRINKKGSDDQGWDSDKYEPPTEIQAITLKPSTVQAQQDRVVLKGQRPGAYQGADIQITPVNNGQIDASFASSEARIPEIAQRPGQRLEVVSQQPAAIGEKPSVIRTEVPNYRLPDNSLFKLNLPAEIKQHPVNSQLKPYPVRDNDLLKSPPDNHPPAPDNSVLIETDPQFTQLKKWLGTDYMQRSMLSDHNNVHKRLGDGFYEQRLIREQIINLTGKRYLPGHQNDEEQFKSLMNAGLRARKAFDLAPGIALSAEQMSTLTEDMVWLVNIPVTLPDGRQQTVLAPQVYVRTQAGSLDGSGALLSGSQVNLQLTGDLLNQGRVVGQDIHMLADNIRNQGSHLQGDTLSLQARTDMVQRGGTVRAKDFLAIQAGNNIDIASTTRSGENQAGNGRFSSTYVDNVASIYVQGADGKLHLQAGNDISLSAAQLATQGKNSDIRLAAGRNIQLGSVKTARYEHTAIGDDHRITRSQSGGVGAEVNSAGQIQVAAGRDVNAKAAEVTAGSALQVSAGRDVNILADEQQQSHDEYHRVEGSNSLVSSKTTITQYQFDRKQALSSTLSGDTVNVQAGKDITVAGSNVVGTHDITMSAGDNLTATTARETHHETHRKEEKQSGLMGTGGMGFTVGAAEFKQSNDSDEVRYKGSTVGSSEGNVTLTAKNQATLHGSDVMAGKNINIEAKDVAITAAKNSHTDLSKTEQKQSGFTLALSGAVGSAIDTAVKTANEAKETKDNRMQALKGTQAVLSGAQSYQAWELSQAQPAKADAINQAGGKGEKPNDAVGIQLSYGKQSSKSETRHVQTEAQGSTLNAGRDIRITATGDQPTQQSGGDIQIQGSALKAGHHVELNAKRDIVLGSAENTQTTRGENSSKGGSVGVGLTAGQGGYGIKFSASINAGKGHEKGDGVTHTETLIDAGHQVKLQSGQDTTLKGAQVSGESVTANIGRNLHLQSEQDKDSYDSKQENISAGASFTYGSMSGSASVNAGRDKMHSQFDSVNEQTGIFAGKGGFDVKVGEHTQLDGAVIASTADKDKNRLETGTLGFSDIENKAEYQTEHQSVGISTGGSMGSQMGTNMASNMLAGTHKSDSKSSTTHAAVGDGTIIVRDADKQKQAVSDLSRDTDNAANGLNPIFDKEKEQQRLAQAQAIANIGTQVMDIYNTQEAITATKKATEKLKDPQEQQALKQQAEAQLKAEAERKNDSRPVTEADIADRAYKIAYDTALTKQGSAIGGSQRQAVTAVVTALQGLAGGDIKAAIASGAAPYLANAVKALTYGNKKYGQLTAEEKATNLVAHAILGGVIAEMKGGSAMAGATGAVSGELAASAIASALYPAKNLSELSPDEKEKVSNLSTLAGGIAAGLATDSTAGGVAGAQTAKNAVENNSLFGDQARKAVKESTEWWKDQIREKLGEGKTSTAVNSVLGALNDAGDFALVGADYLFDGAAAITSCAIGDNYCQRALNDLEGKNQAVAGSVKSLMTGESWQAIKETAKKAGEGDQLASEKLGAAIAGVLLPGKKVPTVSSAVSGTNKLESAVANVNKTTSGAENIATYPKLKADLVQQNLENIAKQDSRLAAAVKGSGSTNPNFSVGMGTVADADRLGKIWIGDGGKLVDNQAKCPGCWISADGARLYRPPTNKKSQFAVTGVQANFQLFDKSGNVISNGHLNVTK
ncbi:hemagglutinin repeat-containing protein [Xenorhabdus bovienii]|uniref:hemagglutinin repeat-containing protein n=1 Tax=Xenorhabdus bovienii TaxID=40576 RepID=UPI0023B31C63|nr:hemagglutinin repeat-containing protein [Xenorhabdus bovienii]MDE9566053.1 hemagglutinin repeat-containing protein [Xenorhabdus bovienii]